MSMEFKRKYIDDRNLSANAHHTHTTVSSFRQDVKAMGQVASNYPFPFSSSSFYHPSIRDARQGAKTRTNQSASRRNSRNSKTPLNVSSPTSSTQKSAAPPPPRPEMPASPPVVKSDDADLKSTAEKETASVATTTGRGSGESVYVKPFAMDNYTFETSSSKRSCQCCRCFCCCKSKGWDDEDGKIDCQTRFGEGLGPMGEDMLSPTNSELIACYGPELETLSLAGKGQGPKKPRRSKIPPRPDSSISLWSIVKNAIGKDLTKLPLPVNFNEPLSMLQRLTEDFEYSAILDKAAGITDSAEQMAFVAAFTVSAYASSAFRTGKPFNPLLGETFECDRTADLGWRCISEQVSHHPPLVAQHCQSSRWVCWQSFSMSSKFKGNSIEILPKGITHLVFPKTGSHYTWQKVPTMVHNIMLGRLWIDQEGEMDIFNHTKGDVCHMKFCATSVFRGDAKRVEGKIVNSKGIPKVFVSGYWDSKMEASDVTNVDARGRVTLGPPKLIWSRVMPPHDSEKFYNFTLLAIQLNEMEQGVAPTDSRRRPDQRLMENGHYEQANLEKVRLEDKQRSNRRKRVLDRSSDTTQTHVGKAHEPGQDEPVEPNYEPEWFHITKDPLTGKLVHTYSGEYWECKQNQDWSRCPDIY